MPEPPLHPAGEYVRPSEFPAPLIAQQIVQWNRLPARVAAAVAGWTDAQLDALYRNWTVRQIVHHLADSHMNAFIRIKTALIEDSPTIKPYDETRWAETSDVRTWPVADSLSILTGLHARLGGLLATLAPAQLARSFCHPQYGTVVRIDEALAQYVWHGEHHLAQIEWVKANRLGSS